MSSNSLCHFLVLKIHSVVDMQILASFVIKKEIRRWTVTQNEKTLAIYVKLNTHQRIFNLALYIQLNTHQRIFNRVFRCHQIDCVMFQF